MSDDLRTQIYKNLDQKETSELVDIWQSNDRFEWSETAFDIIQEILQERLGELPPQGEPLFDHDVQCADDEFGESQPVFYTVNDVLWLEACLNRAAIASVVITIILGIFQFSITYKVGMEYLIDEPGLYKVAGLISLVLVVLWVSLECIIVYFSLKALASILIILMEMEFNSRSEEFIDSSETIAT